MTTAALDAEGKPGTQAQSVSGITKQNFAEVVKRTRTQVEEKLFRDLAKKHNTVVLYPLSRMLIVRGCWRTETWTNQVEGIKAHEAHLFWKNITLFFLQYPDFLLTFYKISDLEHRRPAYVKLYLVLTRVPKHSLQFDSHYQWQLFDIIKGDPPTADLEGTSGTNA